MFRVVAPNSVPSGGPRHAVKLADWRPWRPAGDCLGLGEVLRDGAWAGQQCFILGGGPSLKGFDFDQLRGELVIGVNRAYEVFDPAVAWSQDQRFWVWAYEGRYGVQARDKLLRLRATKALLQTHQGAPVPRGVCVQGYSATRELRTTLCRPFGFSNNSGYSALNLALALGATPIYLLGFDMGGPAPRKGRKQRHWHDGHPRPQDAGETYPAFIDHFRQFAPEIRRLTQVINCCPDSGLDCFPRRPLGCWPLGPERPLVIGYYTAGTGYEEEAKRMTASAHRFGLETDVRSIESRGGWQANTYYKCAFLQEMLDEHPDRPLLFLDADVEMKGYPALFDDMPADFAVNMVNWANYNRPKRRELNTSVIFMRNTPEVRSLLKAWERLNAERIHTGTWEQKNLQDLIEAGAFAGRLWKLPDTYCQIFDLMKSAGLPIIELRQASRRLKKEVGE